MFISILSAVVTAAILGALYKRMIDREVPTKIDIKQALFPVALGIVSELISGTAVMFFMKWILSLGFTADTLSPLASTFFSAFAFAGFPEELFKMIMILITLLVFKNKVDNVYEYILIGAAVGIGFSIAEDFGYGTTLATLAIRLPLIAGHMVMDMIMGQFLGLAAYNATRGEKPVKGYYALAFLVPVLIHTMYDAGTIFNKVLMTAAAGQGTSVDLAIGIIIGIVGFFGCLIIQFVTLIQCKKNAEKLSAMKTVKE